MSEQNAVADTAAPAQDHLEQAISDGVDKVAAQLKALLIALGHKVEDEFDDALALAKKRL